MLTINYLKGCNFKASQAFLGWVYGDTLSSKSFIDFYDLFFLENVTIRVRAVSLLLI